MAEIPRVADFRRNTSPKGLFQGYGTNMTRVLCALEAYWEGKGVSQQAHERLLYNLWKECGKWLKLKEGKPPKKQSELFQRRKLNVEIVKREAMAELKEISVSLHRALNLYQDRKSGPGSLGMGTKELSPGYIRERDYYLQQGKRSGSSLSESYVQGNYHRLSREQNPDKLRQKHMYLTQKRYEDLTPEEALKLSTLYGTVEPVVFKSKIERMQYLATVDDGLFYDIDSRPISMLESRTYGGLTYVPQLYAMDEYGNLFTMPLVALQDYVESTSRGTQMKQGIMNHSSFLAGKEVICAGCIHIGYSARQQKLVPGVLSHIDNNSGHYKPTTQHLRNCLIALRDQGVDLYDVRVLDKTPGNTEGCYWANDFIDGPFNKWAHKDLAPPGLVPSPPVLI